MEVKPGVDFTCGNCPFGDISVTRILINPSTGTRHIVENPEGQGFCRIDPPGHGGFPRVKAVDWCWKHPIAIRHGGGY